MTLMIDNYDSFTYNLVQYLEELGAEVTTVRHDAVTLADVERLAPARIVISPGPGAPRDAGLSCDVIRAWAGRVPILGVCLGLQVSGQWGGSLPPSHLAHRAASSSPPSIPPLLPPFSACAQLSLLAVHV